ncbi:hypothetical protein KCP78_03785 [Salmonella enterica subsp. enterica]|nr:hypothetical protein KCP78_03785 [Salmonella enterica subsp. enterica]
MRNFHVERLHYRPGFYGRVQESGFPAIPRSMAQRWANRLCEEWRGMTEACSEVAPWRRGAGGKTHQVAEKRAPRLLVRTKTH